ncbi:MAG: TatD family hydrolase [Thermodesulfobacteriota bacterium]
MFSDAHTHLIGNPFGENILEPREIQTVLKEARDQGVVLMVVGSHDLPSSERVIEIASSEENVYVSVGLHPWIATPIDDRAYKSFLELTKRPKVVAIGEIGVDHNRSRASKDVQLQALIQQLRLARETGLPALFHQRGYHEELMEAIYREKPPVSAIHGFSGDLAELKEWLDLGYYVIIGRSVLGKEGEKLKAVVQRIPEDKLLLETDGAARSPKGVLEGQARVLQVAEVVASWRGTTAKEVGETTTKNLKRMLRI